MPSKTGKSNLAVAAGERGEPSKRDEIALVKSAAPDRNPRDGLVGGFTLGEMVVEAVVNVAVSGHFRRFT